MEQGSANYGGYSDPCSAGTRVEPAVTSRQRDHRPGSMPAARSVCNVAKYITLLLKATALPHAVLLFRTARGCVGNPGCISIRGANFHALLLREE
jgi:hypothetical protein